GPASRASPWPASSAATCSCWIGTRSARCTPPPAGRRGGGQRPLASATACWRCTTGSRSAPPPAPSATISRACHSAPSTTGPSARDCWPSVACDSSAPRCPVSKAARWWAVPGGPGRHRPSFGLETHTPLQDKGLTFLLDRRLIPQGLGWIFPVGQGSLGGLGACAGRSRLEPALERLLGNYGTTAESYPGTYFPSRLLAPTVDRIFAVGDAAGQVLPAPGGGSP